MSTSLDHNNSPPLFSIFEEEKSICSPAGVLSLQSSSYLYLAKIKHQKYALISKFAYGPDSA